MSAVSWSGTAAFDFNVNVTLVDAALHVGGGASREKGPVAHDFELEASSATKEKRRTSSQSLQSCQTLCLCCSSEEMKAIL